MRWKILVLVLILACFSVTGAYQTIVLDDFDRADNEDVDANNAPLSFYENLNDGYMDIANNSLTLFDAGASYYWGVFDNLTWTGYDSDVIYIYFSYEVVQNGAMQWQFKNGGGLGAVGNTHICYVLTSDGNTITQINDDTGVSNATGFSAGGVYNLTWVFETKNNRCSFFIDGTLIFNESVWNNNLNVTHLGLLSGTAAATKIDIDDFTIYYDDGISGATPALSIDTDITDGDNISITDYPGANYTFYVNWTATATTETANLTVLNNGTINQTYTLLNGSVNNLIGFDFTGLIGAVNLTINISNQNASDSVSYDLYFDAVVPNLTITSTVFNNSIHYIPRDTVSENFTCSDVNLFSCGVEFRDAVTNTLLWQQNQSDINSTIWQINFSQLSSFFQGSKQITVIHNATDAHTDGPLEPIAWYFQDNNMIVDNDIFWEGDFQETDGQGQEATYFYIDPDQPDRYKLKMTFPDTAYSHTIIIGSHSRSLVYRPDDGFMGHFVYVPGRRWIDHEGENVKSVQVYPLSGGRYRMVVEHHMPTDEIEFESLGNLNFIENEYTIYVYDNTNLPVKQIIDSSILIDSASYVNVSTLQFNTTSNADAGIFASMMLSKYTLPQTSVVYGRFVVDGVAYPEQSLRTVSGTNDVGSAAMRPLAVPLTAGEHSYILQIRETGAGIVNVSNIHSFVVAGYDSFGYDLEATYLNYSGSTASTSYAFIDDGNFTYTNATPMFSLGTFSLNASAAATPSFYLQTAQRSPVISRYLSGTTDIGSAGVFYLYGDDTTAYNLSLYMKTDAGTATATGSVFSMRTDNADDGRLYGLFGSNNLTNGTLVNITSGSRLVNITYDHVNETAAVGIAMITMSLDAAGTARLSVYENGTLCEYHDRYFSSASDIGNMMFYFSCPVTADTDLYLSVTSDQAIQVYDEGLSVFAGINIAAAVIDIAPTAVISQDLLATQSDQDNAVIKAYATDPDSLVMNFTVKWYIDDVLAQTDTQLGITDTNYTFTLLKTNFAAGQTINATVQADDGQKLSAIVYSTESSVYAGTTPSAWNSTNVDLLVGYAADITEGFNLLPYVFIYLSLLAISFRFIHRFIIMLAHSFGAMLGMLLLVTYGLSGTPADIVKTGFGLILTVGSAVLFIRSWFITKELKGDA